MRSCYPPRPGRAWPAPTPDHGFAHSAASKPCAPRPVPVQEGSKAIFHLEAFVARFMADYKQYMVSMFG